MSRRSLVRFHASFSHCVVNRLDRIFRLFTGTVFSFLLTVHVVRSNLNIFFVNGDPVVIISPLAPKIRQTFSSNATRLPFFTNWLIDSKFAHSLGMYWTSRTVAFRVRVPTCMRISMSPIHSTGNSVLSATITVFVGDGLMFLNQSFRIVMCALAPE